MRVIAKLSAAVLLLAILAAFPEVAFSETPQERDARMAWWREAKFGLFIHFGLFSLPTDPPGRMNQYFSVPIEEFHAMPGRFKPEHFDADRWARCAKLAGMKYVVLVTKSHDGWCLFDSKHTEFDVMGTPFRQDILKPLAEACRREGLKIGWYYSIIDWDRPDYVPRRSVDPPVAGAEMDRYVEFMKNQLRELLTNYGPIDMIWFDGNWEPTWTDARGKEISDFIRGIQPGILINNRVGKVWPDHISQGRALGDYDTPEQMVPAAMDANVDWETCRTVNDHWQYMEGDENWKSTTVLIQMLVDIASKGGNLLLDVGPNPDGVFPQTAVERLEAIGRWMRVNGESIYGTQRSPLAEQPAWGRVTMKTMPEGVTRLYLHVFTWPQDGRISAPLGNQVLRAFLLADAHQTELRVSRADKAITIDAGTAAPDPHDSVVVLEVEGTPNAGASGG